MPATLNPIPHGVNEVNIRYVEVSYPDSVANNANFTVNFPELKGCGLSAVSATGVVENGGPNAVGQRLWNPYNVAIVSFNEATGDLILTNKNGGAVANSRLQVFFLPVS